MSRKYIRQVINQNFVYPNNEVYEYDDQIVHDINDNSVSGTVINFTATTFTSSSIVLSFDWTWSKNNAEPFISPSGKLNLFSVHMMAEGQDYYKPFRMVDFEDTSSTGSTTTSGTFTSVSITPAMMGISNFLSGTYYFEIRFIGHRAIYPICASLNLTIPTPTPTPTPTLTPTITPTQTPTPTITPTSGGGGGTGLWTISNYDCGGGTVNDVGINGSFMGSLPLGPSTFPLTSTLGGSIQYPSGVVNGSNTIQINHSTNLQGSGNCLAIFIFINGSFVPDYEDYTLSSSPISVISGVMLTTSDDVLIEVRCYEGPCP